MQSQGHLEIAQSYLNNGNRLKDEGNLDAAIASYQKALEIKPDYPEVHNQLGELYLLQGKIAEAIASCQLALKLQPNLAVAYKTLGNTLQAQGKIEQAIRAYSKAVELNPEFAEAYTNIGSMLAKQGQLQEAIPYFQKAIAIKPDLAAAYWNLGNALLQLERSEEAIVLFRKAIELQPKYAEAYGKLSGVVLPQEKSTEAPPVFQKTPALQPNSALAHFKLGTALAKQEKFLEAIAAFQKAVELQPNYAEAYSNLGWSLHQQFRQSNPRDFNLFHQAISNLQKSLEINPGILETHLFIFNIINKPFFGGNISLATFREAAQSWLEKCQNSGKLLATLAFIKVHLISGFYKIGLEKFLEIEPQIYQTDLNNAEIMALYGQLVFFMNYLRDDLPNNSKIAKVVGQQYADKIINANQNKSRTYPTRKQTSSDLKIGMMSANLGRHSVGWCSAAIIRELSKLKTNLYFYVTSERPSDTQTALFEKAATKFYRPSKFINEVPVFKELLEQIEQDELDILIDLDSLTIPVQVDVLSQQPAPVCLSWLGFEAPFISDKNYFLCDRHTHPAGTEQYYREKLVRMPDSFVAVDGFECKPFERTQARKALRLAEDQVVYLCSARADKVNPDLIKAQVNILKHVPDSTLIYKGNSDIEVVQTSYRQECEAMGVGFHRIKFLPRSKSEEEHRTIYKVADVLLDPYPYNGGTHTLEALWFNLPVVTRTGEQYLSRMGYSFLQTLSITEGISRTWEEYIDWGIKLGQDISLRQKIQDKLEQSKQPETLSPLWNPQKFARDMYAVLAELLNQ